MEKAVIDLFHNLEHRGVRPVMTDSEIGLMYRHVYGAGAVRTPAEIIAARAALVAQGRLRDSGEVRRTSSGGESARWELTKGETK